MIRRGDEMRADHERQRGEVLRRLDCARPTPTVELARRLEWPGGRVGVDAVLRRLCDAGDVLRTQDGWVRLVDAPRPPRPVLVPTPAPAPPVVPPTVSTASATAAAVAPRPRGSRPAPGQVAARHQRIVDAIVRAGDAGIPLQAIAELAHVRVSLARQDLDALRRAGRIYAPLRGPRSRWLPTDAEILARSAPTADATPARDEGPGPVLEAR